MNRGPWHQCGDRSQKLVVEQIEHGAGVGVILSTRDLSYQKAEQYAAIYHDLGAQVLIDLQFYVPGFTNISLASYPTHEYRAKISQMQPLSDNDLNGLTVALQEINQNINADGIISPAIIYQAGRPDTVQTNARLFSISKQVGDELGIPTYATVVLGKSVTSSDKTLEEILSPATSLLADGWYFIFEFDPERIPSQVESVSRCCIAGLRLACTGRPVLHAYAGPMALLSFGFGANAAGIGHCQNLWKFCPERWQPQRRRTGGTKAPARFFSRSLWGTIVYPDEVARMSIGLQEQILTSSPFSTQITPGKPFLSITRWNANKHLVHAICSTVAEIAAVNEPRINATQAISLLQEAVKLHGTIVDTGLTLRDNTNVYQENWRLVLNELLENQSSDFDYLELLRT